MVKVIEAKKLQVTIQTNEGPLYAVRGVDLDLFQGETLALVGESGSGKSIATHSLMGLLPKNAKVTADKLAFGKTDLLNLTKSQEQQIRGAKISMIFQDPLSALNPTMRVGKQIAEALTHHQHISHHELKQRVLRQIKDVGIPNPSQTYRKYPHQLSGGQRQRILIAMALIDHPEVLIADEPTTALDVTIQAQILQLLKQQKQKYGLSMIFITHDMGVVAAIADRVAVMYAGEIIEVGTAEEIFYHPQHPYTWGLLEAVPSEQNPDEKLFTLPGTPPDLKTISKGDPFAPRNPYALDIDFEQKPPVFQLSDTHFVKSWLLDKRTPAYTPPETIQKRWQTFKARQRGRLNEASISV
ncbi:ABC transporter ATP-binding protein [Lentilactobacillus diolivorans]|uniref:ABC-type dipeptide oligopeptide nickel transport system protein n=2 Tax=Lentilactobacillus diolivorans TaxID=179838 RepID=A0A0R1SJG1_9LACO|nr:ABC transporter ATP-binding protein [Lentilactobacillus diolivorans]KRL66083.1 ABC-type dipeptide oligopeptide nickel transport system protein [Lentilactobacillus diolivorans DSM 14421]GEP24775.1 ABC transporter ATP-binding protein [Lentilactobacillus diolivorans]